MLQTTHRGPVKAEVSRVPALSEEAMTAAAAPTPAATASRSSATAGVGIRVLSRIRQSMAKTSRQPIGKITAVTTRRC